MSDVPYITKASISHDTWNTLFAEMDRKMGYVFDNKSPICIGEYRRLPSFGMPFYFVSGSTPWSNRFARVSSVTAYDHDVMNAIAAAAIPFWFYDPLPPSESIVSPSRREMVFWNGYSAVHDIRLLLSSLSVHTVQYKHPTADTEPQTYWLIAGIPSRDRQQVERFAVAEIIAEGVTSINLPDTYDRFSCFRIHNLNHTALTVTWGSNHSITVPKMECRTVRRDSVTSGYTDDGRYLFKMRADDPRFYRFQGIPYHAYRGDYFGIQPANLANNVVNPWQVAAWVDALVAGIPTGPEGTWVADKVFWRQDPALAQNCASEMPWWSFGACEKLGDAVIAKGRFGLQHKTSGAVRWAKWNGIGLPVTDDETGVVLTDVEQQTTAGGLVQVRCANHYAVNQTANLIYDSGAKGAADISVWYTIGTVPNLTAGTFYKRSNGTNTITLPVEGSSSVSVTFPTTTPSATETTFSGVTLDDLQGEILAMAGDGDGAVVMSPNGLRQNWLSVPDSAKVIFGAGQNLSCQLFNDDFSRSNSKNWSLNWSAGYQPFQLPAGPQYYGEYECGEALAMKDTGGGFEVKWQCRYPVNVNWPMALAWEPSTGDTTWTRRWYAGNTWRFPSPGAASIIAATNKLSDYSVFPSLLHFHYNAIAQAVNMVCSFYPLNWKCLPEYGILFESAGNCMGKINAGIKVASNAEVEVPATNVPDATEPSPGKVYLPYRGFTPEGDPNGYVYTLESPFYNYPSVASLTVVPANVYMAWQNDNRINTWANNVGVSYSEINSAIPDYLGEPCEIVKCVGSGSSISETEITSFFDPTYQTPDPLLTWELGTTPPWPYDYNDARTIGNVMYPPWLTNPAIYAITIDSVKSWAESKGFKFVHLSIRETGNLQLFTFNHATVKDNNAGRDGGVRFFLKTAFAIVPGYDYVVGVPESIEIQENGTDGLYASIGQNFCRINYTGSNFEKSSISCAYPFNKHRSVEVRSYGLPAVIRKQVHKTIGFTKDWRNGATDAHCSLGIGAWPKEAQGPNTPTVEIQTVSADSTVVLTPPDSGQLYPVFVQKLLPFPS